MFYIKYKCYKHVFKNNNNKYNCSKCFNIIIFVKLITYIYSRG